MTKPKRTTAKTSKKSARSRKSAAPKAAISKASLIESATPVTTPKKSRIMRPTWPKRRVKPEVPPARLPSVFALTKKSLVLLWQHHWLFLGIVAVYAVLNLMIVRGFSGIVNLEPFKEIASGNGIHQGVELFSVLLKSTNKGSSDAMGVLQTLVVVVTSLAIVWTLRQVMAGAQVRIRDGFYKGMYPLVPVLLVFGIIIVEFIPLLIGGFLYSLIVGNGIAKNFAEVLPWGILYFAGLVTTLYLWTTSIIALYIVTLPDMTPFKAMRSARELVEFRRWAVLRKLLFLPLALMVVTAAVIIPMGLWLTALAPWVFFGMMMFGIVAIHTYIYTLYRELLA